METYREKADTLASRFAIPKEEAMKALEECDGDILDAVSLLECKGIIKRTSAAYSTRPSQNNTEREVRHVEYGGKEAPRSKLSGLIDTAEKLLKMSTEYKFNVFREEKNIISMPVFAIIFITAAAFWVMLPLLAVGLLAGLRYEITKE